VFRRVAFPTEHARHAGAGHRRRWSRAAAVRAAVREAIGDGAPRKSHAREALVDAVALLADRGALATGDLKDELYPRYEAEYSTKRTMWNSLDRHLDGVPGVHKPEYGTWAVDVKALLET